MKVRGKAALLQPGMGEGSSSQQSPTDTRTVRRFRAARIRLWDHHPARDRSGAQSGVLDMFNALACAWVYLALKQQQVAIADDRGEVIIEFVNKRGTLRPLSNNLRLCSRLRRCCRHVAVRNRD